MVPTEPITPPDFAQKVAEIEVPTSSITPTDLAQKVGEIDVLTSPMTPTDFARKVAEIELPTPPTLTSAPTPPRAPTPTRAPTPQMAPTSPLTPGVEPSDSPQQEVSASPEFHTSFMNYLQESIPVAQEVAENGSSSCDSERTEPDSAQELPTISGNNPRWLNSFNEFMDRVSITPKPPAKSIERGYMTPSAKEKVLVLMIYSRIFWKIENI